MQQNKKIVIIGEILTRISNVDDDFSSGSLASINYGGAEFNVACNLGYWKNDISFITKAPETLLTEKAIELLCSNNINCENVLKSKHEMKNGIYFLKTYQGALNNEVTYDRSGSAFCNWKNKDFNLNNIFNKKGILYISGISLAVSKNNTTELIQLLKEVKSRGLKIILDFNYRAKLWNYEQAKFAFESILPYVDHAFCGIKDISLILGLTNAEGEFSDKKLVDSYNVLMKKYPNLSSLASSNRNIINQSSQEYTSYLYIGNKLFKSDTYKIINPVDRIGTGDCLASGIIHGLINGFNPKDTVDFGAKAAVLKHYLKGDNAKMTISEIQKITVSINDVNR